jgi:hypothetical protein
VNETLEYSTDAWWRRGTDTVEQSGIKAVQDAVSTSVGPTGKRDIILSLCTKYQDAARKIIAGFVSGSANGEGREAWCVMLSLCQDLVRFMAEVIRTYTH